MKAFLAPLGRSTLRLEGRPRWRKTTTCAMSHYCLFGGSR